MARPAGYRLSPAGLKVALEKNPEINRTRLTEIIGASSAMLADAENRWTGVSAVYAERIAAALNCDPALIFPELTGRFEAKPKPKVAAA